MKRKFRKALETPFPERWRTELGNKTSWWSTLSTQEQGHLEDLIRMFLADKSFEGSRGFEPDGTMKLVIAAHACLLILGLDYGFYDDVTSIVVSPTAIRHQGARRLDGGIVNDDAVLLAGQAILHGPVLIAWDQLSGGQHPDRGHNVVFHEFAHKLDMRDGAVDGVPPMSLELQRRWESAIRSILQRLRAGDAVDLDSYGATNPSELLAVVTEAFFVSPLRLQLDEPDLYELLSAFYRQDPASRVRDRSENC